MLKTIAGGAAIALPEDRVRNYGDYSTASPEDRERMSALWSAGNDERKEKLIAFLFKIPASGERPMTFAAKGLPKGLKLDPKTGIIRGCVRRSRYPKRRSP